MYKLVFFEDAKKDLKKLQIKAPHAVSKLAKLLNEIREHPPATRGFRRSRQGCRRASKKMLARRHP
ncbi:MAG: hypothetical protein SPK76_07995, partial [Bacteroidales bacterium]|nr:hypothetical protein [Bacteroidales bacterium]